MIRVILVDDHELFCEGLRALLSQEPAIEVVGTAGDARQAQQVVADHPGALVIVDVSLPGSGGVALVRELKRADPMRPALVLTMHEHADVVADALDSGADGYALKSQPPRELVAAIHKVAGGGRYLAPGLTAPQGDAQHRAVPSGLLRTLSKREREIFACLVRGDSNQQIARQLFISVKTVETHRMRVLKKLDVHSMAELVRLAVRHGHLGA
jgi:DNA-binding NarL/FixJ family response regulator